MDEGFDVEKILDGVMSSMKVMVSTGTFTTFLKNTTLVSITEEGERLLCTVGCPTAMIKANIEQRFWGQLVGELTRLTGRKCELLMKIQTSETNGGKEKELPLFEERKSDTGGWKKARLKDDSTFENYAVGGSNQMAYAAAQAVARKPGDAYNPLFIYGGVGVGKTHLMQAIGHEVVKMGEGAGLFCTGEEFTNDLVEAI